jgi:pimeloyl-ACP methyl ester carboxylesterase
MNTVLKKIITDYKIPANKVAIGGFSAGGTIALRYTELCKQYPALYPVSPSAVFTCDSPIDLGGLYHSAKRELEKNFEGWWLDESRMIIRTLGDQFGEPEKNAAAWGRFNPFNAADTAIGNEQHLMNTSYRTYHDVDVQWQLDNRGRSLYQINALDASELISRLRMRGNKRAEFIQSKIPGRRSNGQRHPHSWNIIDAVELIEWIRKAN